MASWLHHPWSLNKINKKKLSEQMNQFEASVSSLEEGLLLLLSNVNEWKNYVKNLTALSREQLTAEHILQLRALSQQSQEFQKAISLLTFEQPIANNQN